MATRLASHNPQTIEEMCNRVVVLEHGVIQEVRQLAGPGASEGDLPAGAPAGWPAAARTS